jgi:hypothetical protein
MTAVMLPASTGRTLASVRIQCDLMHRCMGCLYWSFSSVAYLSWRSSSYYGIFILEFLQCGLFILVVFQLQWNLYTGVPPVCLETANWPQFVCASGYIPIHKRPPLSCDTHNARMRPRMQHFKNCERLVLYNKDRTGQLASIFCELVYIQFTNGRHSVVILTNSRVQSCQQIWKIAGVLSFDQRQNRPTGLDCL